MIQPPWPNLIPYLEVTFTTSWRVTYIYNHPQKGHVFAELSGWWSLITWSQLIIDPRLWIGMLCHTRQLTTDLGQIFSTKKITHHFTAGTQNIACGKKRIVLADFQKYFKVKALVDAIRPTESDKSVLRMSTTESKTSELGSDLGVRERCVFFPIRRYK